MTISIFRNTAFSSSAVYPFETAMISLFLQIPPSFFSGFSITRWSGIQDSSRLICSERRERYKIFAVVGKARIQRRGFVKLVEVSKRDQERVI